MKNIYSIVFLMIFQMSWAQLESAHWYFGVYAGLDFTSGSPEVVFDGALSTGEGCASISDPDGNLLFYTDGTLVYNRAHNVMPNGDGLLGNPSSTQSAIIVPAPENENLYYIFTVGADDLANPEFGTTNTGFHYYIVDMTLDGGLGEVLPYNNVENELMPLTSEKVTAVAHANNEDFWVITHFEDKFYAYLVTETGINPVPVISQIGPYLDPQVYPVNSRGYIKLSPNGKKIAVAHLSNLPLEDIPDEIKQNEFYYTNGNFANTYNGYAALYDFDDTTGMISNEVVLSTTGSPYGVEFSYESKYLYFEYDYHYPYPTSNAFEWIRGEVVQYDLNAADILGSATVIFDQFTNYGQTFQARGALQLALDKKIYYSATQYSGQTYFGAFLSVIHSPDSPGLASNFQYHAIQVNNTENPYHHLSFGLPPFITSFFRATIEFEGEILNSGTCLGNEVSFSINSNAEILAVLWDFGDGLTSADLNPTHTYANAGTYTVSAEVTTENENITVTRDIQIHPLPEALNSSLIECDFDGDGLALFTLSEADNQATTEIGNTITYHESENEALSGENPLPNIYANTSNPQILYIRVKNAMGCISVSELELSTNLQEVKAAQDLRLCDLNSDNVETFNLSESLNGIEGLYDENINILSFHESIYDAEFGLNPIGPFYENTSSPQTVYARVETSGCTEVVSFQLILMALPFVDLGDIEICPDGVWEGSAGAGFTSYQWNGLQGNDLDQPLDQPDVVITTPGSYSLTVENENGCEYEEFFTVSVKEPPYISEIIVSDSGIVTVIAVGDSPFEYSLDGVLWQSSNEFYNLQTGDYIAYIRDATYCISDKKGFGILEIPNFISPNNDGYNDTWIVRGILHYENVHIQVFDRYGKAIVDKMSNLNSEIWDGTYLGRTVNTGSYWYIIELTDGRKYVGTLAVRNYDRI